MLTVVHVETGRFLYGGAQQVGYLMKALKGKTNNILVCPTGASIAEAAREYAQVIELPMSGDLDLAFIFRLRKVLCATGANLVHLHSRRGADILGALAAKLAGVPCVMSRRVDNREPSWVVPIKYRLYDHVITISEGIREVLINCGVQPQSLTCVRSAVDFGVYQVAPDRSWFEAEFGLPSNARVFGMLAQLIERKGHRYVLEVAPALLERYPDLWILMFGQGPLMESLQAQLEAPEFQGRVRLAGFRKDLPRVLPNLYGIIHPADREGLGVSLIQAASAGLPLIGTRAGGIPEIVRESENGLLMDVGDTARLSACVEQLLQDIQLAEKLGARGREIAEQEFSIEAMADGNFAVYQQVCAKA